MRQSSFCGGRRNPPPPHPSYTHKIYSTCSITGSKFKFTGKFAIFFHNTLHNIHHWRHSLYWGSVGIITHQVASWKEVGRLSNFLCVTYCTAVGSNHCHVFLSQWLRLGILNIDLQLNGQYPGGCVSNPCFCKVLIEQTFTRSLSTWF